MSREADISAAVLYLARGADEDCDANFTRLIKSYRKHNAGVAHKLYVVLKEFSSNEHRALTIEKFKVLDPAFLQLDDKRFDVGTYIDICATIGEEIVCFLNTYAEILALNWLRYLVAHLGRQEVGLVSASGSFESLQLPGLTAQPFSNPHLRTNGFALRKIVLSSVFKN